MIMFIILLILQLINVFLNFPRTYSKIYIVLLNSSILKVTYFALKHMYLSIYLPIMSQKINFKYPYLDKI